MELKGITREWDSLKKDAAARAASAAPYVKEGKIVDAKDAVALLAVSYTHLTLPTIA